MKTVMALLSCILITGCTTLTLEKGDTKVTYKTAELFRTRNTDVTYDPTNHPALVVSIHREQAISPEMMQAAVAVAGIAKEIK